MSGMGSAPTRSRVRARSRRCSPASSARVQKVWCPRRDSKPRARARGPARGCSSSGRRAGPRRDRQQVPPRATSAPRNPSGAEGGVRGRVGAPCPMKRAELWRPGCRDAGAWQAATIRNREPLGAMSPVPARERPTDEVLRGVRQPLQRGEPYHAVIRRSEDRGRKPEALTDALEQRTAAAEILRAISGSPTDVQPVFDAIVRSAVRPCGGGPA